MTALDDAIVVVGGFKAVADTEVYRNGSWQPGPVFEKSKTLIHHCSVRYRSSQVMVTGGFDDKKPTESTFIINVNDNVVRSGPSLNKPRYSHGCTTFNMDGEELIAVAGGFDGYHVCSSVEFLKVCDDDGYEEPQWTVQSPMNIKRHDFGLTIYGTQLAAFGGEPTIDSDKIEVYNAESLSWEVTGLRVSFQGRHFFSAVSVPVPEESAKYESLKSASAYNHKSTRKESHSHRSSKKKHKKEKYGESTEESFINL